MSGQWTCIQILLRRKKQKDKVMDGIIQGQCHSIYEQALELMKSICKR